MPLDRRAELRVTDDEHEAYLWAMSQDGAGSISAWLRQLANQRVRQLRREVQPATSKKRTRSK
jgi:hypothetical protein